MKFEMWADACAMVEMNRDRLRAERDALRAALERCMGWVDVYAGAETREMVEAALAARGKE